ncbi:MAG TPA: sodium:solute symporter [Anaerohalosphaeraceae bacterium]|nr:sodium:solute symporter [Anaerohalosphaeraceae bacterium]HOL87861.1 sodium:solute symporter [Anaerohalosphaeraceae bacterium]HPP55215.1 sodium:solute symporter [Anaerohalosphaeraceae bacterium]
MGKFSAFDLTILVLYFVGTLGVGVFFYRKSRSTEGFVAGHHSLPGWLTGLSIFATYLSSISFIGIPGKAYADNWSFFTFSLSLPIAVSIAYRYFVPYYRRRTEAISAYEELERRFGYWARLYANLCFLTTQIARMGAVLYLTAVPMQILLGWDIKAIIFLLGISVAVYTLMGGITAVIWTDAIQSFILIGGAFVCTLVMLFSVSGGPAQLLSTALAEGKFSLGSFGPSLREETFWVVLFFGIVLNLQNFGIDQNYVQRYKSSKNDREAGKSLLLGGLLYIPVSAMFFLIGSLLFAYYKIQSAEIPPAVAAKPDYIVQTLPAGLRGLLIAAIFAAAMSTVSTSLNSAATLIMSDFFKRFKADATDRQCLNVLYAATGLFGLFGILAAFGMSRFGEGFKTWQTLAGIFSGGMLGLFLLGLMSRRAGNLAGGIGTALGILVILWMTVSKMFPDLFGRFAYSWNDFLIPVIGTAVILLTGLALRRVKGANKKAPCSEEQGA